LASNDIKIKIIALISILYIDLFFLLKIADCQEGVLVLHR